MPHPVYRAFTAFSAQAQTDTAQFDSLKEGNLTKNWYVFAANKTCCLHLHSHLPSLQLRKKWHKLVTFCLAGAKINIETCDRRRRRPQLRLRKNVGHEHHQQRNYERHRRAENQQHVAAPHNKEYEVSAQRNKECSRACRLCCESPFLSTEEKSRECWGFNRSKNLQSNRIKALLQQFSNHSCKQRKGNLTRYYVPQEPWWR